MLASLRYDWKYGGKNLEFDRCGAMLYNVILLFVNLFMFPQPHRPFGDDGLCSLVQNM